MIPLVNGFATPTLLAVASNTDDSLANLQLILLGLALIAGAAILAGALGLAARVRRHPQWNLLIGMLVLWAVASVATMLWYAEARTDWAKERLIRIESGYGPDSSTIDADAPAAPIALFGGLGIGYVLLTAWTFLPAPRGLGPVEER